MNVYELRSASLKILFLISAGILEEVSRFLGFETTLEW